MLEGKSYLINFIQIQDFLISSSITEIRKGANKADQNVKWFPKVPKTYILLWEAFFQIFSLSFYSRSQLKNFSLSSSTP